MRAQVIIFSATRKKGIKEFWSNFE
jgi:hypothetical protein